MSDINAGTCYFYSDAMNQVGTYTVTITGTVNNYPSQSASSSFTVEITDPCLTTSINVPAAALSSMTTSVLV